MTAHHLLKEKELINRCLYCNRDIPTIAWRSEFFGNTHYKVFDCECGKTMKFKVDFLGSGDDSWIEKQIKENQTNNNGIEEKFN